MSFDNTGCCLCITSSRLVYHWYIPIFHAYTFFCYQHFLFFIHNIQNITKQQTHTQYLKVQSKGRERGKDKKNTKVTPLYKRISERKHSQASIGPIDSCFCTFISHYLQQAMDPICFPTHVRCKPILYYCLLRSCKTTKQHSLLHWTCTETRIIIKKTQTWVNKPINL